MSDVRINIDGLKSLRERIAPAAVKMKLAVAQQIKKDTNVFVPAQNLSQANRTRALPVSAKRKIHMSEHARVDKRNRRIVLIYPGPYARYLYMGHVMKGPKHGPKYATDKKLKYSKSPHKNATSHWFERSADKNMDKWLSVAEREFLSDVRNQ